VKRTMTKFGYALYASTFILIGLQAGLVVMKAGGYIGWSWLLVLTPVLIPLVTVGLLIIGLILYCVWTGAEPLEEELWT